MKRLAVMTMLFSLMIAGSAVAKTYRIAVVPWAGFSPCHVADAKGFWKSEGIDVRVVTTNAPMHITMLKDRLVDLTFDMIGTAIGLYQEGTPIAVVAETDWSHGGDKIIVKSDADMSKLKTLPIGVYYNNPSITYFLDKYLSTIGIAISDTRVVEMEPATLADNFIAGRLGIIVNFDPDAIRAERQGNGKVVATSASYEGAIPEGMIALEDVLKTIPQEDLIKILKGWIKAAGWIQSPANWDEYMRILNTHTFKNDPPYSENDLKGMVDAVRVHDRETLRERNRTGGGLYTYLSNLKSFLEEHDMLKKDFTAGMIFDNTAVLNALGVEDAPAATEAPTVSD